MSYIQDILDTISDKHQKSFTRLKSEAHEIAASIADRLDERKFSFLKIINTFDTADECIRLAEAIKRKFKHLAVFGTGGSSLGAQVLIDLKRDAFGRLDNPTQVYFFENIDPFTIESVFSGLPVEETCYMFISKSGSTLETISQFLAAVEYFKSQNMLDKIKNNFFILTTKQDSPLNHFAGKFRIKTAEHHPDIGGRFSIFSNTALLPAAVAGVDVQAVLKGARSVVSALTTTNYPPATGAAIAKTLAEAGYNIFVLMPYYDRLKSLVKWYRQLWAESIGKEGHGTTPVESSGTVDQHSQLQLYLHGPDDKYYTVIIPTLSKDGDLILNAECSEYSRDTSFLAGKSMSEVLVAEARATVQCLIDDKRPTRTLILSGKDEEAVGALLAHFMLETVITAELYNINAFDQPAVESGKLIARRLLGGAAG